MKLFLDQDVPRRAAALLARGRAFLSEHWWVSTMPGLVIFVAVMGFNLLGDALRDALDAWE